MTLWLLRRLAQAVVVVLLMTLIVFVGLHAIGNPVDILIGQDVDQVDRARIIAELGLDQPLWRQYLGFLNGALHGNLGNSFVYNIPAVQLILQRLPATLELAIAALLLAVVLGVPLGLFAGLFPENPLSKAIMTGSIVGFSLPTFWVGLMLIMAFSVSLGWLPASGRGQTVQVLGMQWSWLTADGLRHLILPALNLSLFKISLVIRLTRAGVREVMPQDFVKFARAKGLSPMRVVLMHILRNTMIPLVTVLG
ncbi:ABC transporter permease, partial [Bordetella hinzii]|nr:ABC transporter permease [Bordetella hinzii]